MEVYEQNLHINDCTFDNMRADADRVLQRLIKNMIEKDSMEGKITITIDVLLTQEFIPNRDPNIVGETRRVFTPKFSHKVGSVMQIKNEVKGNINYDGMELVLDEETGEYILRPITNTEQMSIFDSDFDIEENDGDQDEDKKEGSRGIQALPGPVENPEEGVIDADFKEVAEDGTGGVPEEEGGDIQEGTDGEELEDVTDEFLDDNDDQGDDYSYEEPDKDD